MTDAPVDIEPGFTKAARPRRKKPSPFCLRLSFEERARLEAEAGDMPLGAYIKLKALSEGGVVLLRSRPRRPLKDQEALGQILGLLGRARLSNNLNQLAHAANSGSLPVTPDTESALKSACAEIAAMRRDLLRALGHRADLASWDDGRDYRPGLRELDLKRRAIPN